MLRNRIFNYSIYFNYLSKDKCVFLKSIQNSSRVILANIYRIRNIEIERYFYQKFKYKFNEAKSKYIHSIGKILLGATVLSFAQDKISDDEIQEHFEEFFPCVTKTINNFQAEEKVEIDSVKYDCESENSRTFMSDTYHTLLEMDENEKAVEVSINSFSSFANQKMSIDNLENFVDGSWNQLINERTVKLWRRPLSNNTKLFEYRLCGTFDDISARSFFQVQTDIEYRKEWDDLIVNLRVISTDDETQTDTIQWVTHYPYPMKDREYIFKRRACRFEDSNNALIVSKAVKEDSDIEEGRSSSVRIVDYKSIMYIQSHETFDTSGMDYYLIYYDDPKTNFPHAAVSWMSTAGIPSFMEKVHKASIKLEETWNNNNTSENPESVQVLPLDNKDEDAHQNNSNSKNEYQDDENTQLTLDNEDEKDTHQNNSSSKNEYQDDENTRSTSALQPMPYVFH